MKFKRSKIAISSDELKSKSVPFSRCSLEKKSGIRKRTGKKPALVFVKKQRRKEKTKISNVNSFAFKVFFSVTFKIAQKEIKAKQSEGSSGFACRAKKFQLSAPKSNITEIAALCPLRKRFAIRYVKMKKRIEQAAVKKRSAKRFTPKSLKESEIKQTEIGEGALKFRI